MLSDEEKETMRLFKSELESCQHWESDLIIELDIAEILLNLIEKQSKEIEELNKSDESKEQSSMKYYNLYKKYYNLYKELVDKIKAKIEELDYNDIANFERRCKQEVLQSLLEKE